MCVAVTRMGFMAWSRCASLVASCVLVLACGGKGTDGKDGEPGTAGDPGPDGAMGPAGSNALVDVTPVEAGDDCATGGLRIASGIDAEVEPSVVRAWIGETVCATQGAAEVRSASRCRNIVAGSLRKNQYPSRRRTPFVRSAPTGPCVGA